MAKLITEDQKSRTIDMNNGGGTSERFYTMKDYTEADDAYKALLKYAPENIFIAGFQMARTGVRVRPEFSDPLATLYRGSVSYASPTMGGQQNKSPSGGGGGGKTENQPTGAIQEPEKEPTKEEDPSKVYFTYGTRSTTVLNAIRQDRFLRDAKGKMKRTPKTSDLAINRDADDIAPEGVQVQQGSMFMHVVSVVNEKKLTPEFYKAIPERLMALNRNDFAYFRAGQVQFQGIDIEKMVSGDFKLEYHFEIRTPVFEKSFVLDSNGKGIPLRSKNVGWDGFSYTWLSYQDVTKKDAEPDDKSKIEYSRSVDSVNTAQVFPGRVWNNDIVMRYCRPPAGAKARWKKG